VLRLWSRGDDWISNQVFWRGWAAHERETANVFFQLAKEAQATIDIGAYVGYYSLLAAHANRFGRVVAVEPLPAIYARLLRHVKLNTLSNVECLMAAAGAREGSADFYHQAHGVPTSSSLSREFMAGVADLKATKVPVVTIDGLVRDRGLTRVDLVKIDTESTEPDVLEGMREVLARDRPWIVCEVLKGRGAEERLAPLLEPHGYRFYLLTPEGPVPRSRIEGDPVWLNYLFAARPLPALEAAAKNCAIAGRWRTRRRAVT
jgi:FkbM family methyltransferase